MQRAWDSVDARPRIRSSHQWTTHLCWHAKTVCRPSPFPQSVPASLDFQWTNARASWHVHFAMHCSADGRLKRSDLSSLVMPPGKHLKVLSGLNLTTFEDLGVGLSLNWGCIRERPTPRMGLSATRTESRIRTVTSWKATV